MNLLQTTSSAKNSAVPTGLTCGDKPLRNGYFNSKCQYVPYSAPLRSLYGIGSSQATPAQIREAAYAMIVDIVGNDDPGKVTVAFGLLSDPSLHELLKDPAFLESLRRKEQSRYTIERFTALGGKVMESEGKITATYGGNSVEFEDDYTGVGKRAMQKYLAGHFRELRDTVYQRGEPVTYIRPSQERRHLLEGLGEENIDMCFSDVPMIRAAAHETARSFFSVQRPDSMVDKPMTPEAATVCNADEAFEGKHDNALVVKTAMTSAIFKDSPVVVRGGVEYIHVAKKVSEPAWRAALRALNLAPSVRCQLAHMTGCGYGETVKITKTVDVETPAKKNNAVEKKGMVSDLTIRRVQPQDDSSDSDSDGDSVGVFNESYGAQWKVRPNDDELLDLFGDANAEGHREYVLERFGHTNKRCGTVKAKMNLALRAVNYYRKSKRRPVKIHALARLVGRLLNHNRGYAELAARKGQLDIDLVNMEVIRTKKSSKIGSELSKAEIKTYELLCAYNDEEEAML